MVRFELSTEWRFDKEKYGDKIEGADRDRLCIVISMYYTIF